MECKRDCKISVVERNAAGIPTVWCDWCLGPLVQTLNQAGMRTVASCCGHGQRPPAIMLEDGREVIIARSYEEARRISSLFPDVNGVKDA